MSKHQAVMPHAKGDHVIVHHPDTGRRHGVVTDVTGDRLYVDGPHLPQDSRIEQYAMDAENAWEHTTRELLTTYRPRHGEPE
jgi:hypothetical protein